MEAPVPGAIAYRTADELERGMVIRPPGFSDRETVKTSKLKRGRWVVRTNRNVHIVHPLTVVPVFAEFVDGIGWVTKASEVVR